MSDYQTIQREVDQAVRRALRKYRSADERDLRQEAWRVALEALRTFDPERGFALGAYLGRALHWKLGNVLLREHQMVSFPDSHRARCVMFANPARRSDVEFTDGGEPSEGEGTRGSRRRVVLQDQTSGADQRLDQERHRVRLVARLISAAGGRPALNVALQNERDPRAAIVRERLAQDEELRQLWLEKETA